MVFENFLDVGPMCLLLRIFLILSQAVSQLQAGECDVWVPC